MRPPDDPALGVAPPESSSDETAPLPGDDIEILDDDLDVEQSDAPRRPPVDPRIRARRIEVAREQDRRRLRVVLVVLSVFILAGTAVLVVRSPFLDVDHIVVTGIPQDRIPAVIRATGVHRRDPLMLVSTRKVAHRVDEVPGIGSVHVTRDYPGTLRITAQEQGVAVWARAPHNQVALIGYDGRVQRLVSVAPLAKIELRGLEHVPAPGGRLAIPNVVNVMHELPLVFAQRVGAISAASTTDVRLYLKVGGEVRLGDFSELHSKGVAAEVVLERMSCAVLYVDVSAVADPVAMPAPGAQCNH